MAAADATAAPPRRAGGRPAPLPPGPPAPASDRLGPYRLVREIGRGGMGVVYLGERDDEQYRRRVAIKVVRSFAGEVSAERFRRERQILADLDHPAIARLFDGGVTDDGRLYLVMELVEGEPIDEWCRRLGLDTRARLRLFREVCDAVSYAHRRLIVHRDLKPSNVFVTAEGKPKLLDFGIAKLLDEPAADVAVTVDGGLLCSPPYASPEQLRGGAVGTASDVYSLGVVLYELLVGRRPHGGDATSLVSLLNEVLTSEPVAPSAALTRQVRAGKAAAASPRPDPTAARELRGDLDALVLTALEKEPERRYPSAEALAADVDRYLGGFPLAARPQTRAYRARKFVRRHRLGVTAAVALLVVLSSLVGALAVQSRRLAAERDRARVERGGAQQVADFLVGLFQTASPEQGAGRDVTAGEILARGVGRVEQELAGQPAVQARMFFTIAQSYRSLGLYEDAIALHRRALELRRRHLAPSDPDLARSLAGTALALAYGGAREEATPLALEAVERARRLDRADAGDALTFALNTLGIVRWFRGEYAAAEPLFQEALPLARAREGRDGLETNRVRHNLAMLAAELGRYEEAKALYLEALDVHRRVLGDRHATTATNLNNLGTTLAEMGDWAGAEARFREALAIRREVLGPDHPWVASTLGNLAAALDERGDVAGAVAAYEETLRIEERTVGVESVERARTLHSLGTTLVRAGELDRAEPLLREAVALLDRLVPAAHPFRGEAATALAELLLVRGELAEALDLARTANDVQASLGETSGDLATSRLVLGRILLALGRPDEARDPLDRARRALRAIEGPQSPRAAEVDALLAAADQPSSR